MSAIQYNASSSNFTMKELHLAKSLREMNALAATNDNDWVKYSRDTSTISTVLRYIFEKANAALISGDEEEAYLKFSRVINLCYKLKEMDIELHGIFHETQLEQCMNNIGKLTESLISRYLALEQENSQPATSEVNAKSSGNFLGKLSHIFSGNDSKESLPSKNASYVNEQFDNANGSFEIQEMRLRKQNMVKRLNELRDDLQRRKNDADLTLKLFREKEHLQRVRIAMLEEMRKREAETDEERSRLLRLEEERRRDEQRQAIIRERELRETNRAMKATSEKLNAQRIMDDAENESKNDTDDCKLHFTGFPTDIDENTIFELFKNFGPLKRFIANKAKAGKLLGHGTVEFERSNDASRAMQLITGIKFGEKVVRVSKYIPKETFLSKNVHQTTSEQRSASTDPETNIDNKIKIQLTPKSLTQTEPSENTNRGRAINRNQLRPYLPSGNRSKSRHRFEAIPDTENEDNAVHFRGFPANTNKESVLSIFGKYGNVVKYQPWIKEGIFTGIGSVEYETSESARKAIEEITGMKVCGNIILVEKFLKKENRKMDKNILYVRFFVNDISTETELKDLFSKFGEIRYVKLEKDKTGIRTGFGQVCFRNADHANRAALEMNNYVFASRRVLHVSRHDFRLQKQNTAPSTTSKEIRGSDEPHIYVKNIFSEDQLYSAFLRFGPIRSVKVIKENNVPLGFGFVCFYSQFSANNAIEEMNNAVVDGRQLIVRKAYNRVDVRKKLKKQFLVQRVEKKEHSSVSSILNTECCVCLKESLMSESILLACNHVICKKCIVDYIQYLVNNKEVESIICPKDDCEEELTYNLIKSLIPEKLLNEYDRCLMDTYLDKRDNVIWCPKGDCRFPVFVTPDMTKCVCPKCKFRFCPKCGEDYHGFRECNDFASEDEK